MKFAEFESEAMLCDMQDAVPAERPDGGSAPPALPAGLTPAATEAFRDVEDEFREGLSAELRRRRRHRPDLTSDDVYDARAIVAHAMHESRSSAGGARSAPALAGRRRPGSLSAIGPGLIVIGSVGVGAMHPYLHSSWQVAALVALVVVGLTGVGLTSRGGHHADTPGT